MSSLLSLSGFEDLEGTYYNLPLGGEQLNNKGDRGKSADRYENKKKKVGFQEENDIDIEGSNINVLM